MRLALDLLVIFLEATVCVGESKEYYLFEDEVEMEVVCEDVRI